jgi:GT2 family glycosyltransferase
MAERVVLGVVYDSVMDAPFVWSLFELTRQRRENVAGAISIEGFSGRLDAKRNHVAKQFLERTTCDWLLTLDTDMVFTPEDFDTLLASADPVERPIVTGIYFVNERPPRAAIANLVDGSIKSVPDWEEHKLFPVDYCGSGFMLIHRSVLEKLGDDPYRQDIASPSGTLVTEDYAFCERAREAGFPVHANPDVFIGHVKKFVLGYEMLQPGSLPEKAG